MQEEREEGSIMAEEMNKPLEESEVGPTSIDVTDEQASLVEAFPAEHEVQEQNKQIERVQEESGISKKKSKRRVTSYLSNISKQVEKHGNQISKITMMVQSIQKQKQAKSTKGAGTSQSPLQSIKQIQSQLSQLQKQVTRIQKDIQRIRTPSVSGTRTKTKFRRQASNIKPRFRKNKSLKRTTVKRSRK
jgi:hypothetical protein